MKLPIRFGRLLGMLRLWTIASVLLFSVPLANAVVIVAPTETVSEAVIDQRLRVEGSSYSYFTLALKAGAQVRIQIQVAGGLDSTIQTWLGPIDIQGSIR